jgi:hemoglobin/transferrin/lactoferrin receptor protein
MYMRTIRRLPLAASILFATTGASVAQVTVLDGIVITSTKSAESAVDALAGSSAVSKEQLDQQFQAERISQVLRTIPGVTTQETARDTATAINIRGLQDFGRVNVLIDGVRQNFQRSTHASNGVFYIEPEMIKRVDITRGPTATIYGSGAIGGVAAFETLDADDILEPGEYAAGRTRTRYNSNDNGKMVSATAAMKVGNFDILGQTTGRWNSDYEDGDGNEIPGSNDETDSKFVKLRWRPTDGHQITATALDLNSEFIDQAEAGGSLRDTEVSNRQYSLGYTFDSPSNPLIDFSGKIYRNETKLDQVRLAASGQFPIFGLVGGFPAFLGLGSFPEGAPRNFNLVTDGFDVHNTSRFDLGQTKLALTYGGDAFRDKVVSDDALEGGDELTPSGKRQIEGAFIQSHFTFFDTVDIIGAVRYDSYELEAGSDKLSDEHVSPKITAGVTPIPGFTFYATYAEGFRAPAVTETLISGQHPAPANFQLIPNTNLRPEVAHNIEGGINVKYDGVITTNDAFRAKVTVFQNKVDDFIDQVFAEGIFGTFSFDDQLQYQNISKATLDGVEFQATYDARAWFVELAGHRIRGTDDLTGNGLFTVPADQITATIGFRALDEKLVAGVRGRLVDKQNRFTETDGVAVRTHAESYSVFDLFAEYKATDNATFNLNLDNLTDETYRQHLDQYNSPGFSARVGLTMRLGAQ